MVVQSLDAVSMSCPCDVDRMLASWHSPLVLLIKSRISESLDVEKSEADVLLGVHSDDWKKIRQVVVEVYDSDDRLAIVERLLREQGFVVAVEQDDSLRESRVYMLYATRNTGEPAPSEDTMLDTESAVGWRNNPVLLAADVRWHVERYLPDLAQMPEFVAVSDVPRRG
jgi:hypothetical protein